MREVGNAHKAAGAVHDNSVQNASNTTPSPGATMSSARGQTPKQHHQPSLSHAQQKNFHLDDTHLWRAQDRPDPAGAFRSGHPIPLKSVCNAVVVVVVGRRRVRPFSFSHLQALRKILGLLPDPPVDKLSVWHPADASRPGPNPHHSLVWHPENRFPIPTGTGARTFIRLLPQI